MPDRKFVNLCSQISEEKDPRKLSKLLEELIQLLSTEQDAIRQKIQQNIGKPPGQP